MKYTKRQSGFSLIEILVAFSIFAVSLGLILQIYSKGAASGRLTDEYTNAVIIAQSTLANIDAQRIDNIVFNESVVDFYNVNTDYYELASEEDFSINNTNNELIRAWIEIIVSWESLNHTRSVKLKTLRLLPAS